MKNRHLVSLALFVIAVVLLIAVGFVTAQWLYAVLLGLVFVLAGLFFYRRGK